jgi:hypothetical protein
VSDDHVRLHAPDGADRSIPRSVIDHVDAADGVTRVWLWTDRHEGVRIPVIVRETVAQVERLRGAEGRTR